MPLYSEVARPGGDDDPVDDDLVEEVASPPMVNYVMPNLNECKYLFRMK